MATTTSLTHTLLLILTFLLSLSTPTLSTSSLSYVYGGCSQLRYTSDDTSYPTNLKSLLTSLINSATYSSYNHLTVNGGSSSSIHALYQCRGDLPMQTCASCVANSVSQLTSLCPGTCGGSLQLEGCFLKYDNDSFVGAQDKALLFKRCGPPVSQTQEMAARDAVLDGLVNGPGGVFRVGGSKEARGTAQCVGDLSGGECKECVAEAVRVVKMECGNGGFGDVYLGKCYVRYSVGGRHGGGGNSYLSSKYGSIKNMGVKAFALVVGLLSGIAILIILFTFICRTFAGSTK